MYVYVRAREKTTTAEKGQDLRERGQELALPNRYKSHRTTYWPGCGAAVPERARLSGHSLPCVHIPAKKNPDRGEEESFHRCPGMLRYTTPRRRRLAGDVGRLGWFVRPLLNLRADQFSDPSTPPRPVLSGCVTKTLVRGRRGRRGLWSGLVWSGLGGGGGESVLDPVYWPPGRARVDETRASEPGPSSLGWRVV